MKYNKAEIEIFYKTHDLSIKEVANHFNMPYRTLANWIAKEGWKQGEAIVRIAEVEKPIIQNNTNAVLDIAQVKIKQNIKESLGDVAFKVDEVVLNNLLDSSADEVLLKAMTINYIQKNIALTAVLAKDHLMRLHQETAQDPKLSPIFIQSAEKVAKIFADMKANIYGKEVIQAQSKDNIELEKLSNEELNALLLELEAKV